MGKSRVVGVGALVVARIALVQEMQRCPGESGSSIAVSRKHGAKRGEERAVR